MFESTDDMILKARAMAEDFAKVKVTDFLKAFLSETMIAKEMKRLEDSTIEDERYLNLLVNEYSIPFGQVIALSYACGAMDASQKIPGNFYRKALKLKDAGKQDGEKPSEIERPGAE